MHVNMEDTTNSTISQNSNGRYPSDLMMMQTNLSGYRKGKGKCISACCEDHLDSQVNNPATSAKRLLQLTDGTEIIAQSSDLEPRCPLPRDNEAMGADKEWMDEDDVADLAQWQSGKFNEVIANESLLYSERPEWQQHTANAKSVNRTSSTEMLTSHNDMSFGVPSSGALAETTGGTKVMLMIQPPYVASVTQEAIKLL
ncbi:hypothetical protein EI94DRAFT_1705982 [Lactarius quietus]|nr:hypothetical protein EI94DRAFT_1705982 [Lactarius quietus]